VPYLTPDAIPEDDVCRPLSIPASTDWLAFFGGALTELTKKYNWQQFGAVSVDDTVAKMQEIIDNWYTEPCEACSTPGGYRVIRIGSGGHVEQLDENGDWVDATDDYHIPLPDAREDGTEADQICLAAKNAVNGLQVLYESLSDSWNGDLDEAEAITALIETFALTFGFAIAPITYGIAAFFLPIFVTMYALVEFVIADLWDEDVSKALTCFLVACASNDAGVVTFDYDCFTEQLRENVNIFDLTEDQLRLYLQISYLLYFIGGADGLNFAGGSAAITEDDCSFCDDRWCYTWDFLTTDGGWVSNPRDGSGWGAVYTGALGWHQGDFLCMSRQLPAACNIDQIVVDCADGGAIFEMYWEDAFPNAAGTDTIDSFPTACTTGAPGGTDWNPASGDWLTLQIANGARSEVITRITISGEGDNPFGMDNC